MPYGIIATAQVAITRAKINRSQSNINCCLEISTVIFVGSQSGCDLAVDHHLGVHVVHNECMVLLLSHAFVGHLSLLKMPHVDRRSIFDIAKCRTIFLVFFRQSWGEGDSISIENTSVICNDLYHSVVAIEHMIPHHNFRHANSLVAPGICEETWVFCHLWVDTADHVLEESLNLTTFDLGVRKPAAVIFPVCVNKRFEKGASG
mmetsp:Transcript_28082/g.51169  ORF Transcript_28082/g.51169 Transcript_28082/m.51169 type:complete len:204 (+) Transcript_28082:379-990(+)